MKEEKKIIQTFSDDEIKRMLNYLHQQTFVKLSKIDKYHTGLLTRLVLLILSWSNH